MEFFSSAVTSLSTVVVAIGAGVGVWGIINLMEGYGGDNPASKGAKRFYESIFELRPAAKKTPACGRFFGRLQPDRHRQNRVFSCTRRSLFSRRS